MALLIDTLAVFKRGVLAGALALAMSWPGASQSAFGKSPTVFLDPADDARVIRTDDDSVNPFDPGLHRLPEIIQIRLGAFQPNLPHVDLFSGSWTTSGQFVRLDVVFSGLINPPGTVGLGNGQSYAPYHYGPHPVFGFIEIDVDGNENTGGEVDFPELRYLGNVARLGGLPVEARFQNRAALTRDDCDKSVLSAPFVKRSGEEFHLALLGEEISAVYVKEESDCGDPSIFEAGETWILAGSWLHRAHPYEEFSLQCFAAQGRYMPTSFLRFRHSEYTDQTTVSLVFPLRNSAHASMQLPPASPQANNGCPGDQYSIEEALVDLQFSAINVDPFQMTFPEYQLLADWAIESPGAVLAPGAWRINACLGSAYSSEQSGSARFVWTDMYPNVCNRDFTGDGRVTIADVAVFQAFLAEHDGDDDVDDDDDSNNNSIELDDFSRNFYLYDTNYDGYIDCDDIMLLGDMDWNGVVELDDLSAFALGVLDPLAYKVAYPNKLPEMNGDLNGDGCCDGRDIQLLVQLLTAQP